jgi:hypothetical protein
MSYSDEIDNLPDPRIYNISVEDLYVHVLLFIQDAQGPNAFHHYERYLRWVDPDKKDYQDAINFILKHDEFANIIIFSDDIDWCKIHFKELQNVDFAPSPTSAKPWEDMILMSLCRGNIIANSSYSWWSAWLGDMRYGIKDRHVIAPNRWFSQQSFIAADRFPPHWKLI